MDKILEKMIYFAGRSLDGDIVGQSDLNPISRKPIDKRICKVNITKFYFSYLFQVPFIHPDDQEKYVKPLARNPFALANG